MEIRTPLGIAFARLYFLSFYWIGFVVVMNIIIGAILDFIGTYLTILEEEREAESKKTKKLNIFEFIAKNRGIKKQKKD